LFFDYAKIYIKAGNGGSGCVAFRREKFVPKGGPAGGDGGRGGNIVVRANEHMHTLMDFRYNKKYIAQNGNNGEGSNKTGRNGKDTIINLPVGTVIRDVDTHSILVDLTEHNQKVILAKGGRGGRGNARFVSSTNQAPREFEPGVEGEALNIELELKLIADVGLVGLPNAGKSTLLSCITAAKPKIADYPFTTLQPNLGIVKIDDFRNFVVADIPGLIKGAHLGKGLGHQFLRHIERTRVLAILLDASSENIKADYETLMNELQSHKDELAKKKRLVIFTKSDLIQDDTELPDPSEFQGDDSILISSVQNHNIKMLLEKIWVMIKD